MLKASSTRGASSLRQQSPTRAAGALFDRPLVPPQPSSQWRHRRAHLFARRPAGGIRPNRRHPWIRARDRPCDEAQPSWSRWAALIFSAMAASLVLVRLEALRKDGEGLLVIDRVGGHEQPDRLSDFAVALQATAQALHTGHVLGGRERDRGEGRQHGADADRLLGQGPGVSEKMFSAERPPAPCCRRNRACRGSASGSV